MVDVVFLSAELTGLHAVFDSPCRFSSGEPTVVWDLSRQEMVMYPAAIAPG